MTSIHGGSGHKSIKHKDKNSIEKKRIFNKLKKSHYLIIPTQVTSSPQQRKDLATKHDYNIYNQE